jgi:hypothetical protein
LSTYARQCQKEFTCYYLEETSNLVLYEGKYYIHIFLFCRSCREVNISYLLTLPLFAGVSCVRALSPAWTGPHARETLISRTHLFLPHDIPPTKKSSTIKSWPTFCDQYFWKFPIWNSRADDKRREIRMVKVFKWYPVIDLFDTFTGKLGHGD